MTKRLTKKITTSASRDLARVIAQAAHDTKAKEITVLDLSKISGFTDYFVIATGISDRQVQAICDNILHALHKKDERPVHPLGVEGYQKGHWILIDFGNVIAHVFYEEVRPFYALEKLWGDAPRVRFQLK